MSVKLFGLTGRIIYELVESGFCSNDDAPIRTQEDD